MSEPGQRVSILVVDDEPTLRMAFAFALKEEGVEVEEAPNGAEALAKHAERPFDLILMDLRMPALNGLETLARLREQGDRCPVVLCSAHLTAEDVLLALRHGVVDFLSKPVDLERLRQAKADVLEQPATPWASALSHARRMEFQQAVEDLPEETEEGEDRQIWKDTFRTLASPDLQPAGFFDPESGRLHLERLVLESDVM
ncbi:response regulator [Luteolibacter sp. LG18]|uniref:response regulator n=1 Tax=Luteolibacter sp. LG18 TaxID=2819286 RepID=UPI002B2F2DCA|nr:hypothetical protein llg_15220 [Luteolibacter sp. LG18]